MAEQMTPAPGAEPIHGQSRTHPGAQRWAAVSGEMICSCVAHSTAAKHTSSPHNGTDPILSRIPERMSVAMSTFSQDTLTKVT